MIEILRWYLPSVVVAWALQVVWDASASKTGRLQPPVYYVAVAIVWPMVASALLIIPPAKQFFDWLKVRREAWKRVN